MDQELARLLRSTLDDADASHRLVDLAVKQLVALKLDRGGVVVELGLSVPELAVPLASFAGLEAVLVADQHQDALVAQLLELVLHFRSELAIVSRQVVDQQVGDVVLGGANSDVRACFAFEFADQENETANALRDRSIGAADLDDTQPAQQVKPGWAP